MLNLEEIRTTIENYTLDATYPDDAPAFVCVEEAYQAIEEGNFGIGCVILDPKNNIIVRGHNHVFHPYFRSDGHGEMVAMNAFEENNPHITSMRGYSLITSLESCPMCMARLISSGIETILHIANDSEAGMVHQMEKLPNVWQSLTAPPRQRWKQARCSPLLKQLATNIFLFNVRELDEKLRSR